MEASDNVDDGYTSKLGKQYSSTRKLGPSAALGAEKSWPSKSKLWSDFESLSLRSIEMGGSMANLEGYQSKTVATRIPLADEYEFPANLKISEQDGGYAWVILASCTYLAFLRGLRGAYIGVFLAEFNEEFKLSWTETTIIGAIHAFVAELSLPFSIFIKRFGCRISTILGSILMSLSMTAVALFPNVANIYIFFSILMGVGYNGTGIPSMVPVQTYFRKRKAFAGGMMQSGVGVGLLVGSPLTAWLCGHFGWQGAMLLIGGINLNGAVAGTLLRPFKSSTLIKNEHNLDVSPNEQRKKSCLRCASDGLTVGYFVFVAGWFLMMTGHYVMVSFTFIRGSELGFTPNQAALLVSTIGFTSIGRFIVGCVSDSRYVRRTAFLGSAGIIAGICMIISCRTDSYNGLFALYIIYGIFLAVSGLVPAITVDITGINQLELANGGTILAMGLGGMVANLGTGPIIDATGSFESPFFVFGSVMVAGGALILGLDVVRSYKGL